MFLAGLLSLTLLRTARGTYTDYSPLLSLRKGADGSTGWVGSEGSGSDQRGYGEEPELVALRPVWGMREGIDRRVRKVEDGVAMGGSEISPSSSLCSYLRAPR
eukprot:COSAG02_NODE_1333_length_13206_cov_221.257801_8_plen_103_part_00